MKAVSASMSNIAATIWKNTPETDLDAVLDVIRGELSADR
jgi:hypothetical protein